MTGCGNDTLTVLVETLGPRDSLGVRTKTYPPTPLPGCSVEKYKETEVNGNIDMVDTHRKVYAPPVGLALDIKTGDKIVWQGRNYQLFGSIDVETDLGGRIDHVFFVIRRTGSGGQ